MSLDSTQPISQRSWPLSPLLPESQESDFSSFGRVPSISQFCYTRESSSGFSDENRDHTVPDLQDKTQTRPDLYILNGPGEQEVPEMSPFFGQDKKV